MLVGPQKERDWERGILSIHKELVAHRGRKSMNPLLTSNI